MTRVIKLFCVFHIYAAIAGKGLGKVFETKKTGDASSQTKTGPGCGATSEQYQQARNIIVSALSDISHRVVISVIGNPLFMMTKLNDR